MSKNQPSKISHLLQVNKIFIEMLLRQRCLPKKYGIAFPRQKKVLWKRCSHRTPSLHLRLCMLFIACRGGVEDTRLEARLKTQKNSEAKDQEHKHKCFPKKKGLQNCFSGDFQERKTKKVLANFLQDFWRFLTKFYRFKK